MKLRAMLREQLACRAQQLSVGHTEISVEETVESTSEAMRSSKRRTSDLQHMAEPNCPFTFDDCNTVSLPYWAVMPHYP